MGDVVEAANEGARRVRAVLVIPFTCSDRTLLPSREAGNR